MAAGPFVALVVLAAVGLLLAARRVSHGRRRAWASVAVVAAAAATIAVPAVLSAVAQRRDTAGVALGQGLYDVILRGDSAYALELPDGGGSIVTALDPATGARRFSLRTGPIDTGVDADEGYVTVAADGSVLLGDRDAYTAYDARGRRLWTVPRVLDDPDRGDRLLPSRARTRLPVAFGDGRAVLTERRASYGANAGPTRMLGIDRAGETAWMQRYRSFGGPDSGRGPMRGRGVEYRASLSDVAVVETVDADWDGVRLRSRFAHVTLGGDLLEGPSTVEGRPVYAAGGRVVVANVPVAGTSGLCQLVGFRDGRRAWGTDAGCELSAYEEAGPVVYSGTLPDAEAGGAVRRVDPARGGVVELPAAPGVSTTQRCAGERTDPDDPERARSATDLVRVDGRRLTVTSLTTGEDTMTTTAPGEGAFSACVGPGSLAVITAAGGVNPFVPDGAERLAVYDTRTGRRTASTVVNGGVDATWDWTPGRMLLREGGSRRVELVG